jgi:hypothetical protein
MMTGEYERSTAGALFKQGTDTKIIKEGGVWRCYFEQTLVAEGSEWPSFRAVNEFGGSTFTIRAKLKVPAIMPQLGNGNSTFSRLG